MNIPLIITALIGLSSVLLGSYGEHGLREKLDPEIFRKFLVGLKYHQNYSIILLVLACLQYTGINTELLDKFNIAFWIFAIGLVLFCGTIYLYTIAGTKSLGFLAPIGGISLMAGWVFLLYIAVKS